MLGISEGAENGLQLGADDVANAGEVIGDANKAVLGLTFGASEGVVDVLQLGADDGANAGEILGDDDDLSGFVLW